MYRIITILGVALAVLTSTAGGALHFSLALPIDLTPLALHVHLAYALAAVPLLLLILALKPTAYRAAAVSVNLFLLLALGLQIWLGIALTKPPELPILRIGHLLNASVLLGGLFWAYLRANPLLSRLSHQSALPWFARFGMVLVLVQMAIGGWVSLSQAGMACSGFPDCNAQWWPDADYRGAFAGLLEHFTIGRHNTSFEAQVAINWLHRLGALVLFIVLNILVFKATSFPHSRPVRNAGLWLGFLLFLQIALGVVGYKFNLPPGLSVAHTVCAGLLLLPLLAISCYARHGVAEDEQAPTSRQPAESPLAREKSPEVGLKPAVPSAAPVEEDYNELPPASVYQRLSSQLKKTRSGLTGLLSSLPLGQKAVTEELLEDIEAQLLVADVGIDVTTKIINRLRQQLDRHQLADGATLTAALKNELLGILTPCSQPLQIPKQDNPFVILVVGVNGVGKTTTIGKLAKRLSAQGHSVMLAAGDTFRAAAVEQLQVWGERNNIPVIAQQTGSDSASVIFDAIQSAQSKGMDVLIADTAGRLHTKSNLMEELKKVKRIMAKLDESAPHEVLLVLDAGTGQNALSQAKQFNAAIDLTGLVLTKLDGTAKGGVIFALAKQSGIPIRFIGVGEGIEDLQDFNAETFIDALFIEG